MFMSNIDVSFSVAFEHFWPWSFDWERPSISVAFGYYDAWSEDFGRSMIHHIGVWVLMEQRLCSIHDESHWRLGIEVGCPEWMMHCASHWRPMFCFVLRSARADWSQALVLLMICSALLDDDPVASTPRSTLVELASVISSFGVEDLFSLYHSSIC